MIDNNQLLKYKSKQLDGLLFTDFEINQINCAGDYFASKKIIFSRISRYIKTLKENNVSFSKLPIRIEKILQLGKDSSSRKSCFYRYGLKQGHRKFIEKTKASTITKEKLIKKYGKEATIEMLRSRGASLENYIARHGTKKGNKLWKEYKTKRSAAYKKKRDSGHVYPKYNLDYFVMLHGDKKGTEIYNKKIESQRYKVSKQRYIDEYGAAGVEMCRTIKDTTSLESFINRYGKEEGLEQYHNYCSKLRGSVVDKFKRLYPSHWEEKYKKYLENRFIPTRDNFINRYGEDFGLEKFNEYLIKNSNIHRRNSISRVSTNLFNDIKLIIEDLENYGKNELTILLTPAQRAVYNRTYLKVDCEYNKKIIEFNGDAFHANPKIYCATDKPHPFLRDKTAAEIWQHDLDKHTILESYGYEIMYVWNSEYDQDKSGIIKKCVEFLKK